MLRSCQHDNKELKEDDSTPVLPTDCLEKILRPILTSPKDACRVAAVSKDFRSVADTDSIWERFLPLDSYELIARGVSPMDFVSKKQLYLFLSDSHMLLDRGYLSFMLDKWSGKKCYMLGARALNITYFRPYINWLWRWSCDSVWKCVPNSRFEEVALLRNVNNFEIEGKISTLMLSQNTTYSAYLVFQIDTYAWGFNGISKTKVGSGRSLSFSTVCLHLDQNSRVNPMRRLLTDCKKPRDRKDGWMEIELGEFYCCEGDDSEVAEILIMDDQGRKSGLIVEGIELRPK